MKALVEPKKLVVRTVLGDVAVTDIGVTAMHEHLFIDFLVRHDPAGATLDDDERIFLPAHRAHLEAHPAAYRTNLLRESIDDATLELNVFASAGGSAVVDMTTHGLGQNRGGLYRASYRAGVHVIAGTGHYVHDSHDEYVHHASVERLADEMIRDLTVGDDEGIRCGIIGEIGVDAFEACEIKVFDAAIEAHRATGASVAVHVRSGIDPACRAHVVALIDRFVAAGGDAARLILCHQDGSGSDSRFQHDILQSGAVMSFDTFGFETPFWRHGKLMGLPSDEHRISEVAALLAEGWVSQVVVSHDLCYGMMTTKRGGWGLSHIPKVIVGGLERAGARKADVDQVLVDNPRRLLSIPANGPASNSIGPLLGQ